MERISPPVFIRVRKLRRGVRCSARVVGELVLPLDQRKIVESDWANMVKEAPKKGKYFHNDGIYAAHLEFKHKKIIALLKKTDYAHYLSRWHKRGKTVVQGFKFIYIASLPVVQDDHGNKYFVLGITNSNTFLGELVNFIGGTLDEHHATTYNPLLANM